MAGLQPAPRLSHLVVRRESTVDQARLAWAVRAARAWLGPEVEGEPEGMHRHQTDLRLRVGDRPSLVTFRKAAYIDMGPIEPINDGWQVEISWRAATLAPLFPVFSGSLAVRGDEMTLTGWYAPPGGELGRFADRALLHIAATGTANWLLGELENAARGS
ncbi:MAG: hypothetical protein WD116_02110 [Chloroflexota bacterium]